MASDVSKKVSFQRNDSQRVAANLEQLYAVGLDTRRQLDAMRVSMFWAAKESADCLHDKSSSSNNGTSIGVRIADTEAQLAGFTQTKVELKPFGLVRGDQLDPRGPGDHKIHLGQELAFAGLFDAELLIKAALLDEL